MPITKVTKNMEIVAALSDLPNATDGLTPAQLKAKFDEGGIALKNYINDVLIPTLQSIEANSSGADKIGATAIQGLNGTSVQSLLNSLKNHVDTLDTNNKNGDHKGTWQGYTPTQTDPGIQSVVDSHTTQLAQIAINVTSYFLAEETDWTKAFRRAIEATPRGGTLLIPPKQDGYYCKNDIEKYLFKINKPIRIVGYGISSLILLDENIPNDTDVFLWSPSSLSNIEGYEISGIAVMGRNGSKPARHAIHIDTTLAHQKVARSIISRNFLYGTGGKSIHLSNPTNSDGFFTSWIEKNLIYSGINLQRAGDSLIIKENTVTSTNGIDIKLVDGSNSLVFEENNVTCRGGFRLRSGHNVKIKKNNFEVAYHDMTLENNAYIDIDASDVGSYLYTVELKSNNLTYRLATATVPVKGLRIGKAVGTVIEGNYISNNGEIQIHITADASYTQLGYNLYSHPYADGNVLDESSTTIRQNTFTNRVSAGNDYWELISKDIVNRKGKEQRQFFEKFLTEGTLPTTATNHDIVYPHTLTSPLKHIFYVRERNASGTLTTPKEIMYIDNEKIRFPKIGTGYYDEQGSIKKLQYRFAVPTEGTYARGDIVFNSNPSAGGKVGWVCVTAGTPGTWKAFGAIDA